MVRTPQLGQSMQIPFVGTGNMFCSCFLGFWDESDWSVFDVFEVLIQRSMIEKKGRLRFGVRVHLIWVRFSRLGATTRNRSISIG